MRILYVLHTFPPDTWGGTELHVADVAEELADDHEVRIFARGGNPRLPEGFISPSRFRDLDVIRVNNTFRHGGGFESTYRNPFVHRAFVETIESFRPDVVHIHHLVNLSTSIVEECKRRHLPVVFSLHDFWTVCPRGQRLYVDLSICERIERNKCYNCLAALWPDWFSDRQAEPTVVDADGRLSPKIMADYDSHMRYILGLCDVVLTPSRFHRRRMIESGVDADRVIAIAHGLDTSRFSSPGPVRSSVTHIGYIGSVIPPKGVHVLIEAFRLLQRKDLELHIWGGGGAFHEKRNYLDELQSLALGAGRVRFHGAYEHDEVPSILSELDIVCVPSLWWETFSLTIREAILAGVPVVASDVGAMREAIEDTPGGLLFKRGDPEDLARALRRLIDNRSLREQLTGHAGEVKTTRQNAEDYLTTYKKAQREASRRKDGLLVAPSTLPDVPAGVGFAAPRISIENDGAPGVAISYEQGADGTVTFIVRPPGGGEVRCSVTPVGLAAAPMPSPAAEAAPAAEAVDSPTPPIPEDARDGGAALLATQSKSFDEEQTERAMFAADEDELSDHIRRLDEMIEATHLDPVRDADPGEDAPKAAEKEPRSRTRKRREKTGQADRKQRRRRERSRDAVAKKAEEKEEADAKPAPRGDAEKPPTPSDEGVVWSGSGDWKLPEESIAAEPVREKQPHHRTGAQPRLKSTNEGRFGEGVEDE